MSSNCILCYLIIYHGVIVLKKFTVLFLTVCLTASILVFPQSADAACVVNGEVLNDPGCATNRSTIYTIDNASLRVGWYNGRQYGWARYESWDRSDDQLHFEVDVNGDRRFDYRYSIFQASDFAYTTGYATSSSSARAFRVCVKRWYSDHYRCGPWW